jgi:hypothetical protein
VEMAKLLGRISVMSTPPSDKETFDTWLDGADALAFLKANAHDDEIVIYAGADHVFIHGILVPIVSVSPPDRDDLMGWNCNAGSSWGVSYNFSDSASISISPPLEYTGSKTLDQGEQLVFARSFEGRLERKGYFEILQKFVHVSGLHFLHEKNAYCRLDERGDIEEVIRILTPRRKEVGVSGTIIAFSRDVLEEYMALTESALVRTFDFTRFRPYQFGGWAGAPQSSFRIDGDLFYRFAVQPGNASYFRGFQIVYPSITKQEVYARYNRSHCEATQYASFIAQDWKNGVVKEISCAPGATANYFTKSDLPFELSPAFFRPEVLLKYKADPDKYRLEGRAISCRGTWYLETYDINTAGQVHTYLVYLRNLPYEEQLYWKTYNEEPKAPLSKRAIATDFTGNWDLDYDPIESVKEFAREVARKETPWWVLRSDRLTDQVHYPVTSSADEWASELLHLEQLIVEGYEERWLREKAVALGRTPDVKLRSLKLIEECLMALGFDEDHARNLTAPLHRLHGLRKLKAHASGEEAIETRRQILLQHKSYKDHFRALCAECDEALRTIQEIFEKAWNSPSSNMTK